MKTLKRHFIPVWFFAMVALYQGYNVYRLANRASDTEGRKSFDYSTQRLRDAGYIARFLLKERHHLLGYMTEGPKAELFERRDFDFFYSNKRERITTRTLPPMGNITRQLTARGVEVAIVPIPPKSLVMRDQLPKRLPVAHLYQESANPLPLDAVEDPENNYYTVLNADRSHMVDLLPVYRKVYRQQSSDFLYLPIDYHWSSLAMNLAAMHVVFHLNKKGAHLPNPTLREVELAELNFEGRLLNLMLLPHWFLSKHKEFHFREMIYEINGPTGKNRGRIVLAGDSHAQRFEGKPYSLGNLLARATYRTLLDFTESGGGAAGSFDKMAKSDFQFQPGDLFVWAFQLPYEFPDNFNVPTNVFGPSRQMASPRADISNIRTRPETTDTLSRSR